MSKPKDERFRKRWHKQSHDRKLRDVFWMRLSFEDKGLLSQIECMVASTMEGDESGVLYGEDGRKISVEEFLFLIGGDEDSVSASLKRLCRARQIDARRLESGSIKLLHWHDDQELPATGDSERKRVEADAKLAEEVEQFVPMLRAWFESHGKERVLESDLLSFIKARRGGYEKTRIRFLEFLYKTGVLVTDSNALASLALPPSGVGVGAVSCAVGAGGKIVPDGKFPADRDQDQEPEKVSLSGNQLVPVGGRADTRPFLAGGESERSERHSMAASFLGAHGADGADSDSPPADSRRTDSGHAVPPSREERPIVPAQSAEECCFEPGDAWRVRDAIQATERILCDTAGWNSVPPRKGVRTDRPLSQHALLALNHRLREEYGPKLADRMWRTCLSRLIGEMAERRAYRKAPPNSWTALFSSWLKKMTPEQVEETAP